MKILPLFLLAVITGCSGAVSEPGDTSAPVAVCDLPIPPSVEPGLPRHVALDGSNLPAGWSLAVDRQDAGCACVVASGSTEYDGLCSFDGAPIYGD